MSLTKKLLVPALGLTLGASIINCEDYGYTYYIQNSIYGTYKTEYQVIEDPDKLYDKNQGETELNICTLGHDAKIRFRIFPTAGQDYNRHPITGEINESWEATDMMYPYNYKVNVSGTISNDFRLDLTVSADIEDLESGTSSHVKLNMRGEKVSDELEDSLF